MHPLRSTMLATVLALAAFPATAQVVVGDWTVGVGVHQVNPATDHGALASGTLPLDIGTGTRPSVTLEYFIRDAIGIEVLAALPFEHDIAVRGLGTVGSTRHLPPTVSLQYHFNTAGRISPFVGLGLNYTTFFEEATSGPLAGSKLELDDSWGAAVHVGADIRISPRGALRLDARWIDIDTEVELDGAVMGTANIDPLVYGFAYVHGF